jgi:hypothetical protein
MAKTYTAAGSAVAGDVYTAAAHNVIVTDVNNFIVPAASRVTRTSALNVATDSFIALNFDSTTYDTDSFVGATKTFLTINTAGIYSVTATCGFGGGTPGARAIILVLNPTLSGSGDTTTISAGTRIGAQFLTNVGSSTTQTTLSVAATYAFSASDKITLGVFQTSGVTIALSNTDGMHLGLTWIGRTA